MMRFEHTGLGQTILVQDGEHVLIADGGTGDPVCACGWIPRGATSQINAATLVQHHARDTP